MTSGRTYLSDIPFGEWQHAGVDALRELRGGYWKAIPESPPGLSYNGLFGRSTNQEMLNGSSSVELSPDDWIFLRPTQSEFVFLQFGDIAVYENGAITERWPVFPSGTS